jgi:hypothetical protein
MSSSVSSFRTIAVGLRLVYAGLCLLLLAIVWSLFGSLFLERMVVGLREGLRLVVGVAAGMVLASSVLDIIGRILCLAVPAILGGIRAMIFVSVACGLAAGVISGLQLGHLFLGLPKLPTVVELAGTLIAPVGSILFLVFLRYLALFVNRRDLATRAMTVLILGIVTVLLAIFVVASVTLVPELGILGLVGLVVMVMGAVLVVLYGRLLTDLRKAVMVHASQMSAGPPAEVPPRRATDDQGYFKA